MNRTIAIAGAATMLLGLGALTALPASATQGEWLQQYQRASKDVPCGLLAGQTPWQASFQGSETWTGSYAEWANGGRGGWVCTRTIVWAQPTVERQVEN